MERVNEYDISFPKGDSGVKYLFRGPTIDWGVITLKPGEDLGRHYHHEVQETFFFIEGSATIEANDETYRAAKGDAFRMEAEDSHYIRNDTDRDVRIVFIKDRYLPDDKVNC